MFTGLIEEIGSIASSEHRGTSRRIIVNAKIIMSDVKADDSISINGACQTVVTHTDTTFSVDAIDETLRKTTLGSLISGQKVNLERAVRAGSRLGGHIVQGHVDCVGTIRSIAELQGSRQLWVEFPPQFSQYVVPVGSICLDGVSLTVARADQNRVMVALIPHTLAVTTIGLKRVGDKLNIEFDIIGKYIEKMTSSYRASSKSSSPYDDFHTQPE